MRATFRVTGKTPAELRENAEREARQFGGDAASVEVGDAYGEPEWNERTGRMADRVSRFSAEAVVTVPDGP